MDTEYPRQKPNPAGPSVQHTWSSYGQQLQPQQQYHPQQPQHQLRPSPLGPVLSRRMSNISLATTATSSLSPRRTDTEELLGIEDRFVHRQWRPKSSENLYNLARRSSMSNIPMNRRSSFVAQPLQPKTSPKFTEAESHQFSQHASVQYGPHGAPVIHGPGPGPVATRGSFYFPNGEVFHPREGRQTRSSAPQRIPRMNSFDAGLVRRHHIVERHSLPAIMQAPKTPPPSSATDSPAHSLVTSSSATGASSSTPMDSSRQSSISDHTRTTSTTSFTPSTNGSPVSSVDTPDKHLDTDLDVEVDQKMLERRNRSSFKNMFRKIFHSSSSTSSFSSYSPSSSATSITTMSNSPTPENSPNPQKRLPYTIATYSPMDHSRNQSQCSRASSGTSSSEIHLGFAKEASDPLTECDETSVGSLHEDTGSPESRAIESSPSAESQAIESSTSASSKLDSVEDSSDSLPQDWQQSELVPSMIGPGETSFFKSESLSYTKSHDTDSTIDNASENSSVLTATKSHPLKKALTRYDTNSSAHTDTSVATKSTVRSFELDESNYDMTYYQRHYKESNIMERISDKYGGDIVVNNERRCPSDHESVPSKGCLQAEAYSQSQYDPRYASYMLHLHNRARQDSKQTDKPEKVAKSVGFAETIELCETHSPEHYDRFNLRMKQMYSYLSSHPDRVNEIRDRLNRYKAYEMPVHEFSRKYTHLFN